MKLLLDENLPVKLKYRFLEKGIDTITIRDMHWQGKENGVLLKEMLVNSFTIFITIDNNLSFQNNFKDYPIAVVVLVANDNTYVTIMEFFDQILVCVKDNFNGPRIVRHPDFKSER